MYITKCFNLSLLFIVGSTLPAFAEIIRNPVYDLNHAKVCLPEPPKDGSKPNFLYIDGPAVDSKPTRVVKREHIIAEMLKRYSVEIDYNLLIKIGPDSQKSYKRLLADAVAPCSVAQGKEVKACLDKNQKLADLLRFEGKTEALKFRRALLRLFETAETGTGYDFAVLRRPWSGAEFPQDLRVESIAISYRPMVDPRMDDAVIRAFLLNEDSSPFDVYCLHPKTAKSVVPYSQPSETDEAFGPNTTVLHEVSRPSETAILLRKITDYKGKPLQKSSSGEDRGTRQFKLVESSGEFSASKPKPATLGHATSGDNEGLRAKMALGYRVQWTDSSKSNVWTNKKSLTPYFSIDSRPLDFTFFTGDANAEGELETDTRDVQLSDMAIGIRGDYELRRRKVPKWGYDPYNSDLSGYYIPGWRFGVLGERLFDNYNNRLGSRIAGEVSLPRFINVKGYRHRESLNLLRRHVDTSSGRKPDTLSVFERAATGFGIEWDMVFLVERLDYDADRTPFDFSVGDPNRRIDQDIIDTVLVGGDFELELTKANMFGAALNENWLKFETRFGFRYGYDEGLTGEMNPDGTPEISMDEWAYNGEAKLTFLHPDAENFGLTLGYEFGENFTDLSELNIFTIGLSAAF